MTERKESEDLKKRVDDSWKEAVEKEKKAPEGAREEGLEATFGLFISGLMMEALVALGEVENPLTKKSDLNLNHAKFLIDTRGMLQDKTKNNLTKEESDMLESILYDLRMRFVNKLSIQG
ncbi:MAG: DUF1844 domain-containing protein [Candidatus Omnitrophica bacterium]|nr:DUF1844 domain-containing protein [Candidatus Omnitrophota bacterium]